MSKLPALVNRLAVDEATRFKGYPSSTDIAAWGFMAKAIRDEVGQRLRDASIASSPEAKAAGKWWESPDAKKAARLADWDDLSAAGLDFRDDWDFADLADPWKDQFIDFAIAQAKKGQAYLASMRELKGEDPGDGLTADTSPPREEDRPVELGAWLKGALVGAALLGGALLINEMKD